MYKMKKLLALFIMISLLTVSVISCNNDDDEEDLGSIFEITSPYDAIDWETFGQYKAALHVHTTNSDGGGSMQTVVDMHYNLGYDILTITDHVWKRDGNEVDMYLDLYTKTWTEVQAGNVWKTHSLTHLSQERFDQVTSGAGRDGRGMLMIPYSAEFAYPGGEEMNVFFYGSPAAPPANAPAAWTMSIANGMTNAVSHNAIFFINHPGRTTNAQNFTGSATSSNNPSNQRTWINKYVALYNTFSPEHLVGMEIFNRLDQDSRHDRVLWDNILTETVPTGRFVWGYGNDDLHNTSIQINYNMMIMPENTTANFRDAMINGHSYAVTVRAYNEAAAYSEPHLATLTHTSTIPRPVIKSVIVDHETDTITITAENATKIVWISEGDAIQIDTGNTSSIHLGVKETRLLVGSYVRANIIGAGGMAVIQPIGTTRK